MQKGVGLVRLRHADGCAHMELAGRADTIVRVTVRRDTQYRINDNRLQVVAEGNSVPHCNWVRPCVVDTAFHLA